MDTASTLVNHIFISNDTNLIVFYQMHKKDDGIDETKVKT